MHELVLVLEQGLLLEYLWIVLDLRPEGRRRAGARGHILVSPYLGSEQLTHARCGVFGPIPAADVFRLEEMFLLARGPEYEPHQYVL